MGTRYPGSAAVSSATSLIGRSRSSAASDFAGTINGINTAFTVPEAPVAASVIVFQNGLALQTNQYSVSGLTITFSAAPLAGDVIECHYFALV